MPHPTDDDRRCRRGDLGNSRGFGCRLDRASSAPVAGSASGRSIDNAVASCGQIITVFAAKDGCGKTTLATNLAVVLHDGGARRVCLIDLDLESGDIASSGHQQVRHLQGLID
jgi:Mrp family chromosome partitioning ATPase